MPKCKRCKKMATDNFKLCSACRERERLRMQRRKAKMQNIATAEGMKRCGQCFRSFQMSTYSLCSHCRERFYASAQKRKHKALNKKTVKDGHRVCKRCLKEKPKTEFRSTVYRRSKLVSKCRSCRKKTYTVQNSEHTKKGQCMRAWEKWKASKCCENCGTKESIEADHLDKSTKVRECSKYLYWASNGGVEALERELKKCRPLCAFCHSLHSSKQRGRNKRKHIRERQDYVNNIKLKIGSCQLCDRKVESEDRCCGFDFDHLKPEKKRESICKMALNYPNAKFYKMIDLEISKTRLLCTNCHKKHSKEQARKISLLNMS